MSKVTKSLFAIILSVVMLLNPMTAEASDSFDTAMEASTITYRWSNTSFAEVSFAIINGIAAIEVTIQGNTGAGPIEADIILSRQDSTYFYSHVYSWRDISQSGNYFHYYTTIPVTVGYTYRATLLGIVYLDGVGETLNLYKEAS